MMALLLMLPSATLLLATPLELPRVWGFNYDRFAPITPFFKCQMNLADLISLPVEAKSAIRSHLTRDFAAMRKYGANAVRLYVSLHSLLISPNKVNITAMNRLQSVVSIAAENGLDVDLSGANVMRPLHRLPLWLRNITDRQLRLAQRTFWKACASQFHQPSSTRRDTIMAFNLINEPIVWSGSSPSDDFSTGCLGGGASVFGADCNDALCYSNFFQRTPLPPGSNKSAFAKEWCQEMSSAVKSISPERRVTIGDLQLSLGGKPTCSLNDGIDYFSLHLYPSYPPNASLGEIGAFWSGRMNALPQNATAMIEEMFPLGTPPNTTLSSVLQEYLTSTSPKARGFMTFYWGTADDMHMPPVESTVYKEWLGVWERGRPWL